MKRNRRERLVTAATAGMATAFAPLVQALSIGAPEFESYLAQPLNLRIPVIDREANNASVDDLAAYYSVRLLPADVYPRWNLEPPQHALADFNVRLEAGSGEQFWVRIRSNRSIREPLLSLLLEIQLGDQAWIRQVDLLIDPQPSARAQSAPVTIATGEEPARPAPVRAPVETASAPASIPRPSPQAAPTRTSPQRYGPVRPGESLSKIAQRVRPDPGIPLAQMIAALKKFNPDAFFGDIHGLSVGATLRVPSRGEIASVAARNDWIEGPAAPVEQAAPADTADRASSANNAPIIVRETQYISERFFAVDLEFRSWRALQAPTGLAKLEAQEPPRFRADWTLSQAPEPRVAEQPPAQDIIIAEPALPEEPAADAAATVEAAQAEPATAPAQTPASTVAEPAAAAPSEESRVKPAEAVGDPPQAVVADDFTTAPEASPPEEINEPSGSGWFWWLAFLGAAGTAAWLGWRRKQQGAASPAPPTPVTTAEPVDPAPTPTADTAEESPATEPAAASQDIPENDSLALRIERFVISEEPAEQRQATVAQALLARGQRDAAERILVELETAEGTAPAAARPSEKARVTSLSDKVVAWPHEPEPRPAKSAAEDVPDIAEAPDATGPAIDEKQLQHQLHRLKNAALEPADARELKVAEVMLQRGHPERAQEVLDRIAKNLAKSGSRTGTRGA